MKRTFLAVLGTLLLGACTNDDTPNVSEEVNEGGNRYLAVSLVANAQTRATRADETYDDGIEAEYAVASSDQVVFYFFDADGKAFTVDEDGNNYAKAINLDWEDESNTTNSVTKKSTAIAVLKTKTGVIPSKVLAVVNYNFELKSKNLDDFRDLGQSPVTNYAYTKDSKSYFMMTSAAYMDGGEYVYTTPISAANLGASVDDAEKNPVNIYVERVVGKVTVSTNKDATFDVQETVNVTDEGTTTTKNQQMTIKIFDENGGSTEVSLQAKINGWQIFNTATSTPLQKNLDNYAATDWIWNSVDNKRSFWSVSSTSLALDNDKLTWTEMGTNQTTDSATPAVYPFENTLDTEDGKDNHTSVAIAATLVDNNGNALDTFGNWLSNYYTLPKLKALVAEYLSEKLCTYTPTDGTNAAKWEPITADDIDFVSSQIATETFKDSTVLASTSANKEWYAKGSDTKLSKEQVDEALKSVPKPQIWTDGKCYYFTTIKHTQSATASVDAVVRNHWYTVTVNNIYGLGTPVFDESYKVDPVRPTAYDTWYLDAQINIQAWNKITNNVDLTSN
jgi:hypothetical protein